MLMNRNKLINSNDKQKLTYELWWLEEYKKEHCKECLIGVLSPNSCYVCYWEIKIGFSCALCSCFIYYSEGQICGDSYDTGSCFCANCQGLIKNFG